MQHRMRIWIRGCASLAAALCFAGPLVRAQQPCVPSNPPSWLCPLPRTLPQGPGAASSCFPAYPTAPVSPYMPGNVMPPEPTTPPGPAPQPSAAAAPEAEAVTPETALAGLSTGAGVGSRVALAAPGGYLDNAIPISQFRLRYDAAWNINRPDRAEYFYAAWKELSFHPHGVNGGGIFFDPNAQGPAQLPANVNLQEIASYLEYAFNGRLSVFAEVPVRFLNFRHIQEDNPESEAKRNPADFPDPGSRFYPEPGRFGVEEPEIDNNPGGLSDINLGFKAALIADPQQYLTFQFRTYANTGDPRTGLGTGHVSLEPSLLYYQCLADRWIFQGQFTDWIPIGGGPMAGNVLSYGLGLGYNAYRRGNLLITPVTEVFGWTVLSGYESFFGTVSTVTPPGVEVPVTHGVASAAGDTIVNLKFGFRTYFGGGSDMYIGYGRAVTGDRWYKDIVRVEYRYCF